MKRKYTKGFTLVELLVVIAIIAILAAALFLVINPAAVMQKSRDARRIGEVSEVNKAMAAAIADTKITAWPAALTSRDSCGTPNYTVAGAGWLGGFTGTLSPYTLRLPSDPTNSGTLCYYGAVSTTGTWEIATSLESPDNATKMTTDGGAGVNSATRYEVGTDLSLM